MEDIQELKPSIFCGVPRVYDRIYTGIVYNYNWIRIYCFRYVDCMSLLFHVFNSNISS
jgi:hypothetical protein